MAKVREKHRGNEKASSLTWTQLSQGIDCGYGLNTKDLICGDEKKNHWKREEGSKFSPKHEAKSVAEKLRLIPVES